MILYVFLGIFMLALHGLCWLILFGDKYMYDDKIPVKTFVLEHLSLVSLYILCVAIGYASQLFL